MAAAVTIALSLGLSLGIVQARLLTKHVAQPQLWIPICSAAFLVGLVVGMPLGGEGRELLSIGVVSVLTAVLSGAGMLWLLQDKRAAVSA